MHHTYTVYQKNIILIWTLSHVTPVGSQWSELTERLCIWLCGTEIVIRSLWQAAATITQRYPCSFFWISTCMQYDFCCWNHLIRTGRCHLHLLFRVAGLACALFPIFMYIAPFSIPKFEYSYITFIFKVEIKLQPYLKYIEIVHFFPFVSDDECLRGKNITNGNWKPINTWHTKILIYNKITLCHYYFGPCIDTREITRKTVCKYSGFSALFRLHRGMLSEF